MTPAAVATVLIVDERPVNRDLVRIVLSHHGYQILEAATAEDALALLHDRSADLVIADLVAPQLDGSELARAIRGDDALRSIPVLFYTATYVEDEIRPIASALDVERVVSQSGGLAELLEAIDDTLATADPDHEPLEETTTEHLSVINAKLFVKVSELEEGARLHQMVDAIVAAGDDPSLPAMLDRIATAAFSLVEARHASVVTVASDNRAAQWVSVGDDPDATQRVELWARGAAPVDTRSFDFLVVPIRIGGEIFGNLVLAPTNIEDGFTEAEVTLLQTLARAAGVAIANSQLYDDARRRQEWLTASAEVTSTMLAANPAEARHLIAAGARRVIGATSSWIAMQHDDNTFRIDASDGAVADALTGVNLPLADAALFTDVAASAQPVVISDANADERTRRLLAAFDLEVGPLLAVPLHASGQSFGVLCIGNPPDGAPFSALDVEMARAFASRAAQTLEFARSEEHRQRLSLAEDRNRIARDLHDVVIQRLFGVGLRLEQLRSHQPEATAGPLGEVIDDLDRTIDEIRNTIFSLRDSATESTSLRAQLLEIVEPATFLLTFAPRLRLEGPIDQAVPEHVHPHLLATLGELLSNTIRHAHASRVDLLVRVDGDGLSLQVTDNGRGLPSSRHESGLANLRRRAEELGGSMKITPGLDGRGTTVAWHVPLDDQSGEQHTDQSQAVSC